ncbi:MAG: NADPH-dependent glutamate synthase [Planctomycetota bacterium]
MDGKRAAGDVCRGTAFSITGAPDEQQDLIIEKRSLAEDVRSYRVHCPQVAAYCAPGQFVIVRGDERGERIPLTIADFSREEGWITLVVQLVGASTRRLDDLTEGTHLLDVVGPLGNKTEIADFGTVAMVAGGIGVAPIFPIQRAMKDAGNTVVSIMGARSKNLLFWEERMSATSDRLFVATDDGSCGEHGFVTMPLRRLIDQGERLDRVIAIGPPGMMRAVADVTREPGVKTIVSLNSIMVDGTGMCGGCRVEVGGETRFTCVDGPEFDAHAVDFDVLMSRLGTYDDEEGHAHKCLLDAKEQAEVPAPIKAKSRVPMPTQAPQARMRNFDEVALGYTPEMAQSEALRCLQCKKQPCVPGCPVDIDIPSFIRLIREGRFTAAAIKIKEQNNLPAICGRVCPQETQCEALCVLAKKGEPVAIGRLERFVADCEAAAGAADATELPPPTGRRVAIVGAGPAGLTAAADLSLMGHKATVFEALHAPGGVLIYGIPEFRLPKDVVCRECTCLEDLGVEFRVNTPVGQSVTVPELLKSGFDAAFIGTGAGLPWFLGIQGENLKGVYSSSEFLTRINLMKAYKFPEYGTPVLRGRNVAVVGGGNVAMDCARSALRLGAGSVSIVYRRSRKEMPAREEEIEHALEEGVVFRLLTNPVRVLGDEEGCVSGLECIRMELGEPDSSGRRRPLPVEGSEHVIETDQFIVAIGQSPNPVLTRNWSELELDKRGNIPVDEDQMTNIPGVFAGGDIVTGAATVIEAMGAGKRAARAIDAYLKTK